jgi:hypothetical protein
MDKNHNIWHHRLDFDTMTPLHLTAFLFLVNLSFSFAPRALTRVQSLQYGVSWSPSCRNAKPKANWQPLVGVFRSNNNNNHSNKEHKNGMALGVQMAQLLLDTKRQATLKQDLKIKFPMIPAGVMESTIDKVAQSFATIAPSELRQALQPGGMAKMRPTIQRQMVNSLLKQTVIRDLPFLTKSDKQKLCETVVDLALDYVLKDAQELLASPEVRLAALNVKKHEIYKQMGWKKVTMYRIRHNPLTVALTVVVSAFLLYQQRKVPVVAAILSWMQTASVSLITFWKAAYVKLAELAAKTGLKKIRVKKTLLKRRR